MTDKIDIQANSNLQTNGGLEFLDLSDFNGLHFYTANSTHSVIGTNDGAVEWRTGEDTLYYTGVTADQLNRWRCDFCNQLNADEHLQCPHCLGRRP